MAAGTLAYSVVAGVCLAAGIIFFVFGLGTRSGDGLTLSYGVVGIVSGVTALSTLLMQSTDDVDVYATYMKWVFGTTSLLSVLATYYLVSEWTEAIPTALWRAVAAGTVVLLGFQLVLPSGLLVSEVTALREVTLLGESFSVHVAASSPWRIVLDVYLAIVLVSTVVALFVGVRRGPRLPSLIAAAGMLMLILFAGYDSLVDEGQVDTPYLAPFGTLFLVASGGFHVARLTLDREQRLRAQARRLSVIAATRSDALDVANTELLHRQDHRERTESDLVALTSELDLLNSMIGPATALDDMVNSAMISLLASTGRLVDADRVELAVNTDLYSAGMPARFEWASDRHHGSGVVTVEPIRVADLDLGTLTFGHRSDRVSEERQAYWRLAVERVESMLHRMHLVREITNSAIESERHRLARELHDSVTQQLYAVTFLSDALPDLLEKSTDDAVAASKRIRTLVLLALADLRSLLFELRPLEIDERSLSELLVQLGSALEEMSTSSVVVDADDGPRLDPAVKFALYRVAQEAAANAIRHGSPTRVGIELRRGHDSATLTVTDDGTGFEAETVVRGHGMNNLRERVDLIGADLRVESIPGVGTTVSVEWVSASSDSHGLAPSVTVGADEGHRS